MDILEEGSIYGNHVCCFKTNFSKTYYNLTFTPSEEIKGFEEIHLQSIFNMNPKFDCEIREFVCTKVLDYIKSFKKNLFFAVGIDTSKNMMLFYKFARWIECSNLKSEKLIVSCELVNQSNKGIVTAEFRIIPIN
ncbi:MAG: hypothetical protein ACPGVD_10255 [Flavobacteriales bacterium]